MRGRASGPDLHVHRLRQTLAMIAAHDGAALAAERIHPRAGFAHSRYISCLRVLGAWFLRRRSQLPQMYSRHSFNCSEQAFSARVIRTRIARRDEWRIMRTGETCARRSRCSARRLCSLSLDCTPQAADLSSLRSSCLLLLRCFRLFPSLAHQLHSSLQAFFPSLSNSFGALRAL